MLQPFICFALCTALAMLPPPPSPDIEDGLYEIDAEAGADTPAVMIGDQRIGLGERILSRFDSATIRSTDNHNRSLHVSIDLSGEPPRPGPIQTVLVIEGRAYRQTSSSSNGTRVQSVGFRIDGNDPGRVIELAKRIDAEVRWRRHPGHRLLVEFDPTKPSFGPDDPVKVRMTIKNTGPDAFTFQQGGRNRAARDNQFTFAAWHNGDGVRDIGTIYNFGGLSIQRTLEPLGVFDATVDLRDWFDFDEPGAYTILGSYFMEFHDHPTEWTPVWQDYATAEFHVTIEAGE